MSDEQRLTHLDEQGAAHMVDIAEKAVSHRRAVARSFVEMQPATLEAIVGGGAAKGDVLAAARIAGISAAKKTSELIPLCHPIALTRVTVDLAATDPGVAPVGIRITAAAETDGKTGVEMEALTAASVAALTIYDMCKAIDRGMRIGPTELVLKEGGKSGRWSREEATDVD